MTTTIVQNGFLPTQIPGCQMWFDAADITSMTFASATTISTWKDKSGNGRNATNGAYVAPTYSASGFNGGYPGILFNGSSSMLNTAAILPTPVLSANGTDTTIFIIFNSSGNPVSGGFGLYGLGSQGNTYTIRTPWNVSSGGGVILDTCSSRLVVPYSSVPNPPQQYSVFRSGASYYFYQFGSLTTSNLSATGTVGTTSQTFCIGGGIADSTFFNSYISEIVIYNVAITTIQRQQVEGYLAWKWGLQANLPSTHPYKNTPAAIITQPTTLANLSITNRLNNAAFLPTNIPGCQLWFDATDSSSIFSDTGGTTLIKPGGSIARWNDKSGNNNYLQQGSAGSRPVYQNTPGGYKGVYFSSTGIQLTTVNNTPIVGNAARTVFLIQQAPNGGSATRVQTGPDTVTAPPSTFGIDNNPAVPILYCPYVYAAADNTISVSLTSLSEIWVYYDPSVSQIGGNYNFSSAQTRSTTLNTAATPWYFGYRPDGNGSPDSYTCEFILYDTFLTTAQRQQIEGYLAWKWGLQGSLPSTHPYKAAPFTPFSAIVSVASLLNTNQLKSILTTSFFNPKNISGIALWLDAADRSTIALSGTTVTQWNDKSGNGYAAVKASFSGGTITLASQNQRTTMNVAANVMTIASFPWTTWNTMFFVISTGSWIYSSGTVSYQGYTYTGNWSLFFTSAGGNAYNDSVLSQGTEIISTLGLTYQYFIFAIGYGGGTQVSNYTINGTVRYSTSGGGGIAQGTTTTQLNINGNFNSAFGTTQIAEVVHYNRELSTAQRQQVEGYLAWKWGLQANLPSTHPYKILPPPPN